MNPGKGARADERKRAMSEMRKGAQGVLRYRELTLEPASFRATLCGRRLRLTKREFEILALMLSSPPGRIFSRRELAACGWEGGPGGEVASIYVHIFHIRKKMQEITGEGYIETVRGRGFRLTAGAGCCQPLQSNDGCRAPRISTNKTQKT